MKFNDKLKGGIRTFLGIVTALALSQASLSFAKQEVRLGVLDNSPPMSIRQADGSYSGYSIDLILEVCKDRSWSCTFIPSSIQTLIEDLKTGKIDIAVMSLLPTPERRKQILLSRTFYTSISVWFAPANTAPDQAGIKVAVVQGSAQARYAKDKHWNIVEVTSNKALQQAVISGDADGMVAPMMTVLGLRSDPALKAMSLNVTALKIPELTGETSLGVTPLKPELKKQLDQTLERLERNGTYDKINSKYVPFRVN